MIADWPWLDQKVLDGALISGLELDVAEGVNRQELGLTLRSGGNSLQAPDDWIRRIRSGAEWAAGHSWRAETMCPVHRTKTRDSKCFCFAAEKLPLGAYWPQCPLSPMPVPLRQAVPR